MRHAVESIGKTVITFTTETGKVFLLLGTTLRQMLVPPFGGRDILRQARHVGVSSVPVVLVTALFSGMVLALQSYTSLERLGAESLVGSVVALSMTKEMGPVLTGLIVAGRAGAAMAAELGTMRVTEQIDALETLAANPVKYLIVPRFLAGFVMLPALTVISDIVGIAGGYMVTVGVYGASSAQYMKRTWEFLHLDDIYVGLVKAASFGASLAFLSCYRGFYSEGGAEGVGRATTGAVVVSFMTILISDYFLSAWLF
jgi:phospholipid/cholesterol/gamma-HCH transport system permease protein